MGQRSGSENKCIPVESIDGLFTGCANSFGSHPPLKSALGLVEFKEANRELPQKVINVFWVLMSDQRLQKL